ncbi:MULTISPECIES: hypothetical protein [Streptomyces]|uniref:hypothetical protein n=1 Tax=Streptomyces TaxID=1883 RepID=UPI0018F33FFC|nr:hypothetical protein [Streptomyces sp. N35]
MSSTPRPRPTRSAEELNEQIRRLMLCSGGRLSEEQRKEYAGLVVEWSEAVRDGVLEAV